MNYRKALAIAVDAIKKERQRWAVDKNLAGHGLERGQKAVKRYKELTEALDILVAEKRREQT